MTSIKFMTLTPERDFADTDEPRNSRGETLDEYIATLKGVHATLKQELLHYMAQKRKAKEVATMLYFDKRVHATSQRLNAIAKRARFYGVSLK